MRRLWLVAVMAMLGCGQDTGTSPLPPDVVLTASFVAGDSQSGTVGSLLPQDLVVNATDKETSAPVTGIIINFVVTTGNGTVFAPAVLVDGNGSARNRWTLGPIAGTQRVEARAINQNGEAVTYDTAIAVASPGPAVDVDRTRFSTDIYGNERLTLCPIGTDPIAGCYDGRGSTDTARVVYWYTDSFGNHTSSCAPTIRNSNTTALLITGPYTDANGDKYFHFRNVALGGQSAFWVWMTFSCVAVQDSFVVQTN